MTSRFRFLFGSVVCCAFASSAWGATSEASKTLQRISFRTQKPTVAHLKTEKEIKETTELLKQIGCEVKSNKHDGHVDLSYECRYWRSITLKTPAEVAQWDKWLSSKGFFVVHNTPGKDHKETVQYRLEDWKTLHFKSPQENEAYIAMFKMLGCETKMEKHGDHEDVMVRCAAWGNLGVPNHSEAAAWMGVLKKLGFAVMHEH